ncbi:MAG TPA: glycosyltransferase [Flavilitoribacter sp.]|nr:glycosyltransferase [Flavilitoribacter sp.]
MLSVLLPVYNFDVRPLVTELRGQCLAAGIPFEIICIDDCSDAKWQALNRGLEDLEYVAYRELEANIGRSAIRNLLVKSAVHPFLLFLDCDSGIIRTDFIRAYADQLSPDAILYGGRQYSDRPPADPSLNLHWLFGVRREALPVEIRQKAPYDRFMTNNFLAPKSVMERIPFEEKLRQYGHEDTLFGFELKRASIPIRHLDNPVEHLGLEPAEVFLDKTRKSVENLAVVHRLQPELETSLLKWGKRFHLLAQPSAVSRQLLSNLRQRLVSGKPRLFLLDAYKLLVFLSIPK